MADKTSQGYDENQMRTVMEIAVQISTTVTQQKDTVEKLKAQLNGDSIVEESELKEKLTTTMSGVDRGIATLNTTLEALHKNMSALADAIGGALAANFAKMEEQANAASQLDKKIEEAKDA